MIVGELIMILSRFPHDLEVVVDGYETGTDPLTEKRVAQGFVDKTEGYPDGGVLGDYGDFELKPSFMKEPTPVIIISRSDRGR